MRRQNSRPKYLVSSGAPGNERRGSGGDEEGMEAVSRLRRAEQAPKRLSPLESATARFAFRSPWPDLEFQPKDIEAHQNWCFNIEDTLADAFLDAQCPYRFLDSRKRAPNLDQTLQSLSAPWSFREFLRDCDFPDEEKFNEWCEVMQERQQ